MNTSIGRKCCFIIYGMHVFNLTASGLKSKMYNIQLVLINYCICLKVYYKFQKI